MFAERITYLSRLIYYAYEFNNKQPQSLTAQNNYASTPKLPLPFDDHYPHLIHPSSTDPTHHLKWHSDPISRFATVHFPDKQTDRQTDRPTDEISNKPVRI